MTKKEVAEELLNEYTKRLFKGEIMERYLQREVLLNPKLERALGQIQAEMVDLKKYQAFMEEIIKEM